jgi:hypothetical protein
MWGQLESVHGLTPGVDDSIMPFDCRPVSLDEVLLEWYRSEAKVDWQREHRESFERQRGQRSESDLASAAVRKIKGALLQCRTSSRPFFEAYPTSWFSGYVTVPELASSVAIDCWGTPAPATVAHFALEATRVITPLVREFPKRVIVLSMTEAPDARLILLDGYRRSSRLIESGGVVPIPVFWGVCAQLSEWDYYR